MTSDQGEQSFQVNNYWNLKFLLFILSRLSLSTLVFAWYCKLNIYLGSRAQPSLLSFQELFSTEPKFPHFPFLTITPRAEKTSLRLLMLPVCGVKIEDYRVVRWSGHCSLLVLLFGYPVGFSSWKFLSSFMLELHWIGKYITWKGTELENRFNHRSAALNVRGWTNPQK